jgi:uncharacterized protein YciI
MRKAWESRSHTRTEESKRKTSETLKQGYAEGRIQLVGAALAQSQSPFAAHTEEERKARKLETQRLWRAANPEVMARYKRKYTPQPYGLTEEQYEEKFQAQHGLCAICKKTQQGEFRLAIDHDHTCCPERSACEKCRRGLLCSNCNQALGLVYEDPEILQAMLLYLKSFKKV